MTLEQLAAIADIVAALAIVVTLVYIAIQTRQSNRNQKAEAIKAALQNHVALIAGLTDSDAQADVFRRFLVDFHALTMNERGRVSHRLQRLIGGFNHLRMLHLEGLLPEEEFVAIRNIDVSILRSQGGRAWFAVMRSRYPRSIRDYLAKAIDDPLIEVLPYDEWFPEMYGRG